jgi:hypothetical protein
MTAPDGSLPFGGAAGEPARHIVRRSPGRNPAHVTATITRLASNRFVRLMSYPCLLVAVGTVLTLFRISGTSVGMYVAAGAYAPPARPDPALIAGKPRLLRWDEWVVNTPYIVSQSKLGYPRFSPSAVGGQDLAVIGAIPNRHWSTFFKPYNWPFFAMDVEHAFAARWWLIGLVLLISSYGFFFVLTGRIALASAFSATLFVSPFFQWWYLPGSLAVAGFAMAALMCLIEANRRSGIARWLLLAGSIYSLVGFTLLFYPPFQISTAIVVGLVGAGWLSAEIVRSASGRDRMRPILLIAIVGLGATAILLAYYIDVSPTIAAITNTVYPGDRRVTAGDGPIWQLFGGPFDFWLTRPDVPVDQPRAASFLLIGVFIAPQVILVRRYRADARVMPFMWPAIAAMILLLAWALLPLPAVIGKLTLLDRVQTFRVILGVGIASSLVTFLALAAGRAPKKVSGQLDWGITLALLAGAAAAAGVGGLALRGIMPPLGLRFSQIGLGCVVFVVLVGLVLTRRSVVSSLALLLAAAIMGLPVNPLYRGLEPLESSPLQHAVKLGYQDRTQPPGGAVLSYLGSAVLDSLVVSSGHPVINATNLYPNAAGWRAFDPSGAQFDAWDRYSGTVFVYSPSIPGKIQNTGQDSVVVVVNPCDPGLDRLHVTTVISPTRLTDPCLTELGRTPVAGNIVAFTYQRHART